MTNAAPELPSIGIDIAILDHINDLRNSEVSDAPAEEITGLICTLANDCNTKFLNDTLNRTDHYPELEKRLGGFEQSSNLVETSIHLVNGDDFYG